MENSVKQLSEEILHKLKHVDVIKLNQSYIHFTLCPFSGQTFRFTLQQLREWMAGENLPNFLLDFDRWWFAMMVKHKQYQFYRIYVLKQETGSPGFEFRDQVYHNPKLPSDQETKDQIG